MTEDPLTGLRSPGGGPTPAPVGAVMLRGRRLRARRRVLALGGVAVVALALVGVGLAVATGDDSAESVVAGPATTPGVTAPDPWAGARWVVHGPDGLVTDAGTQVWEGEPASDGLPTVQRTSDGAIIFHEPGSSWHWSPEAAAPVRRDESVPRESPPPPEVSVRTAANGWTAMGVEPGRLQVLDARNELAVDLAVGGPEAPEVDVVDFDGRRLIAAARSAVAEPADHVYVDLSCPGCTEWFRADPGSVALVGPDVTATPERPGVGGCDTWATPPVDPPDGPPEAVVDAFERIALGVTRCDRTVLGTADTGAWDDDGWSRLRSALSLPFLEVDGTWWWPSPAIGRPVYTLPVSVRIDADGSSEVTLDAVVTPTEVVVQLTADHLVLDGRLSPDGRDELVEVAVNIAPSLGVEVVDRLGSDGSGPAGRLVDIVIDLADIDLTEPAVPEATIGHSEREIRSWFGPDDVEKAALADAARALQELAAGAGPGDLRFADEVALAAGPSVVALVPGAALAADPDAWTIDFGGFGARVGPLDALDLLAAADTVVGTGPHPHCAGPPAPIPVELAGRPRVWLQAAPGTDDSCLDWFAVDVFLDDTGAVAGVVLDVWEP